MTASLETDAVSNLIEQEFPLLCNKANKITYLDHAGASLPSQSQIEGIHNDLKNSLLCNPHTNFGQLEGLPDLNAKIRQARQEVLRFFQVSEETHSVIFTSGTTQSLKLVVENFDFENEQKLAYLDECHTSVVGLRELVSRYEILEAQNVDHHFAKTQKGGLFAFPAMSNFNGEKFPMKEWILRAQNANFKTLLDAASFVSTNALDLSIIEADFTCISFYKIFGLPTGLGALIAKNSALPSLKKLYFGGGTVEMHLVDQKKHAFKPNEGQFEDGTLHYQGIISLHHGFQIIQKFEGMHEISKRTFALAKYLHDKLITLKYPNGKNVVEIYAKTKYFDPETQGGIVNFNIVQRNGQPFGFTEFRKIAIHNKMVVRVGCFCNIGSCQNYLNLTDEDIQVNHEAGHVCGDNVDVINGKITGSIRVSFGHYSTQEDADLVIKVIQEHFVESSLSLEREHTIENGHGPKIISAIYLYPIKSCGALKITQGSWPLSSTSLKYDRQFVIMQGRSTLTQKSEPLLCQVQPDIDLQSDMMKLKVPWLDEVCQVSLASDLRNGTERQLCSGKVCGDFIDGVDCGENVSDWLEKALGLTGLRLIQLCKRRNKTDDKLQSFANEAQFLILNRSSGEELYRKTRHSMEEGQDLDWMLEQFRGNIVIQNCMPYEENYWKNVKLGSELSLKVKGLCTRCNVIGVNQANSERVQEPMQTLAKNEKTRFKFGILAGSSSSMDGLRLNIGDEVFSYV